MGPKTLLLGLLIVGTLVGCATTTVIQVQPRVFVVDVVGGSFSSPLDSYREGIFKAATLAKKLNYQFFVVKNFEGARTWVISDSSLSTSADAWFNIVLYNEIDKKTPNLFYVDDILSGGRNSINWTLTN